MKTIVIASVPHKKQRYNTCGDYWMEGNVRNIKVSELGDERMESLIAIHELIEFLLCEQRGIKEPDIAKFDIKFNESGKPGEPGDDPKAPYKKEHRFAENIERLICAEFGIDWNKYSEKVDKL